MLRRDQQIRTQIHQLADACIFFASFLLAYILRSNPAIMEWLNLQPSTQFGDFAKLLFVVIPGAPLILESQGFYNRSPLSPRAAIFWPLLKGCVWLVAGLVIVTYLFKLEVARMIMVAFGIIGFCAVWLKEEALRFFLKSKMAQAQYHRRFIIAGTDDEIARMRAQIKAHNDEGVEIVAALDLNQEGAQELTTLLHEHSVYGVILSARRAYFEQIE